MTQTFRSRGRAAISPAATGGERHRFRTDRCHSPDARPSRRVYRQLIVLRSNATMRIEAKVRRYTGTRCICSAPEMVRTDRKGRTWPGLAGAELAENGSILPPLDYRRGSKSKADAAELAGRASSNGVRHPDGKGRTLTMSDRFSGKASPLSPSGFCQPWQVDCCLAKRAERGAVRCHI